MASNRPSTPPPRSNGPPPQIPLTPEQVRRMEESRLRAKALRTQQDAARAAANPPPAATTSTATPAAGQKRPFSSISTSNISATHRDARNDTPATGAASATSRPHDDITAARRFTKYVEYDFSKMTDTKGGFLSTEDDPHSKAMKDPTDGTDGRPAHMTAKEWERHQLLKKLRDQRAGPFEPGLSVLKGLDGKERGCEECGSLEIDWKWLDIFDVRVCNACKESLPDKYSLLTKTEARTDYLLTEPELKDRELLPALMRPNPHKSTWNDMQLFLRCQVEAYAFSDRKWGSPEALDAEFEKRETDKKKRKDEKFRSKLNDLRKRTRVDAYKRGRRVDVEGGGAQFGDKIALRPGERHEHEWGRTLVNEDGIGVKRCVECGMEVEELEF